MARFLTLGVVIGHGAAADGRFASFHDLACRRTRVDPELTAYGLAQLLVLFCKVGEWGDSIFRVLKQERVSVLNRLEHRFSHCIGLTVAMLLLSFPVGVLVAVDCVISAVVHADLVLPCGWAAPLVSVGRVVYLAAALVVHTYGASVATGCWEKPSLFWEWCVHYRPIVCINAIHACQWRPWLSLPPCVRRLCCLVVFCCCLLLGLRGLCRGQEGRTNKANEPAAVERGQETVYNLAHVLKVE